MMLMPTPTIAAMIPRFAASATRRAAADVVTPCVYAAAADAAITPL